MSETRTTGWKCAIMITVSCQVTKADVLAFACQYYAESPTIRRQVRNTTIMTSLTTGALTGFIIGKGSGFTAGVVMFFLIDIAIAAMFPSYYRSYMSRSAEKIYAESSFQKTFGEYKLLFTDQGISSSSPTGDSKHLWSAVDHVSITSDYLFIFLAGLQGLIIPRAQVQESTIMEVKAFVEAHLSKAA